MLLSPLVCFLPLPTLLPSEAFLPLRRAGGAQEVKLADDSEEFFPIPEPQNLRCPRTTWPHRRYSEETVPSTSYHCMVLPNWMRPCLRTRRPVISYGALIIRPSLVGSSSTFLNNSGGQPGLLQQPHIGTLDSSLLKTTMTPAFPLAFSPRPP